MTHSDNKGFVCPHTVSKFQIVVVPIFVKNKAEEIHKYALDV